ncbi:hypothetical protein EDB81DRAFT_806511 [Dactylonectria macrodidyma]|uniref:Uncharacterized protein n=1 Tax=Dactylonectria macrodidyma TaxID=307937 RepID=A0A9P9IVR7_9HYPO|nr:hypothetical protein EDB81DRAFT_806511 [Dactylonectria macrodidyma]
MASRRGELLAWRQKYEISEAASLELFGILGFRPGPTGPCVWCWWRKKACSSNGQTGVCDACALFPSICFRDQISDIGIYGKWTDPKYKSQRRWTSLQPIGKEFALVVQHFPHGPALRVGCSLFETEAKNATVSYLKLATSWVAFSTDPVRLQSLDRHDWECYLQQCCKRWITHNEKDELIKLAARFQYSELVTQAVQLCGAIRILMTGWHLYQGSDYIAAPEVISSQLDSLLELSIASLETKLLKNLQDSFRSRKNLEEVAMAVLIVINLTEKDIWRLMHWVLYEHGSPEWKHPTRPDDLLRRTLSLSQAMMALLPYVGNLPVKLVQAAVSENDVRYDAHNPESLRGSVLQKALQAMEGPQLAHDAVQSLSYDNFLKSHQPRCPDEARHDEELQYESQDDNYVWVSKEAILKAFEQQ